jgi:hypothetical protein
MLQSLLVGYGYDLRRLTEKEDTADLQASIDYIVLISF